MSGWAQRDAEEKEERAAWTEARLKQAHELEEENAKLRQALELFALIGDPADYPKVPKRLDVPFEWCELAKLVLEEQG